MAKAKKTKAKKKTLASKPKKTTKLKIPKKAKPIDEIVKRGRGRPKKILEVAPVVTEVLQEPKRGRGRPKKINLITVSDTPVVKAQNPEVKTQPIVEVKVQKEVKALEVKEQVVVLDIGLSPNNVSNVVIASGQASEGKVAITSRYNQEEAQKAIDHAKKLLKTSVGLSSSELGEKMANRAIETVAKAASKEVANQLIEEFKVDKIFGIEKLTVYKSLSI